MRYALLPCRSGVSEPVSPCTLPEIAKTGANSVRLFWFARMGIAIGEAEASIATAVDKGMLPILELHDSTCAWELDGLVRYWTSPEAVQLIQKYQSNLIINIANETGPPSAEEFRTKYSEVVQTMRAAGIHVPRMIDGRNCGRDAELLLAQGPALLEADPDHNLIFSAHLYDRMAPGGYGQLFDAARAKKLTLVIGEFANRGEHVLVRQPARLGQGSGAHAAGQHQEYVRAADVAAR